MCPLLSCLVRLQEYLATAEIATQGREQLGDAFGPLYTLRGLWIGCTRLGAVRRFNPNLND
jgi:hypothetical protein